MSGDGTWVYNRGITGSLSITSIVIIIVGILVLILLGVWIWYMKRGSRDDEQIFDDMEGKDFEDYCADLLDAKGFENVETTPDSHDYGVDLIADKDGISYAIQCKCYSSPVGIKAVQEAYAGKDYYGSMVAVVMSNQRFTKSAVEFAAKLNVILWDGNYVMKLIHEVAVPENGTIRDRSSGGIRTKRLAKRKKYIGMGDIEEIDDIDLE